MQSAECCIKYGVLGQSASAYSRRICKYRQFLSTVCEFTLSPLQSLQLFNGWWWGERWSFVLAFRIKSVFVTKRVNVEVVGRFACRRELTIAVEHLKVKCFLIWRLLSKFNINAKLNGRHFTPLFITWKGVAQFYVYIHMDMDGCMERYSYSTPTVCGTRW